MNRRMMIVAALAAVLLGGCAAVAEREPEPVAVPEKIRTAVGELVQAVDSGAEPRFDGLRCFTSPIDANEQDGERWAMSVSVPGESGELLERVRSAAVELGWQPMRPVGDQDDLVLADHHRFAEPLEVAVRKSRQGVDLWMHETSKQYACEDEEDEPPKTSAGDALLTAEQQAALDSMTEVVDAVPRLVLEAFGGRYSAPSYRAESYDVCGAGDRSGAAWVGRQDNAGEIDVPVSGPENLKAVEGELAAALAVSWRLAERNEEIEDDEVKVELRFVSEAGIGATLVVRVESRRTSKGALQLGYVRTDCVPPTGV